MSIKGTESQADQFRVDVGLVVVQSDGNTSGPKYLRVPSHVIAEVIADEVLTIDRKTGTYFSIRGLGAEIWEFLVHCGSIDDLHSELVRSFPTCSEAEIRASVSEFILALLTDQLLVASDSAASEMPKFHASGEFIAPEVIKYTDMQDLLLADPIHDVDTAEGWPTLGMT